MKKRIKQIIKKNKKLAKKYGLDRHYYMDLLGIDIGKYATNFCDNTDRRYKSWMKERKKYGFDNRETWDLDMSFVFWLYEHLKMYVDVTIIDLEFNKFEIYECTWTQKQAIEKIIEILEEIILYDGFSMDKEEDLREKFKYAMGLWAEIWPSMWW